MSEFLKRFIEAALLAATLLIFVKLAGLWFALAYTKSSFIMATSPELFTYISVSTIAEVKQITTIADGIFVAATVVMGTFVLVKTLLFNDLTRHPRVMVKVIHYNLTGWLEDGQDMYPKLFAWGTFIWLSAVLIAKDYFATGISLALPLVAGIFAMVYTYQVFSFLDTHISDMISYIYGSKRKIS
ncbi:hypothetical protein IT418_03800 [bacterium]|nr:hypothetical protein [bacterium]